MQKVELAFLARFRGAARARIGDYPSVRLLLFNHNREIEISLHLRRTRNLEFVVAQYIRSLLALLCLAAVFAAFSLTNISAGPEAKLSPALAWEYKVLSIVYSDESENPEAWISVLNTAGADGWEVVNTVPIVIRGTTHDFKFLLKRVKPESPALVVKLPGQ